MTALTPDALLAELRVRGALLEGHFRLSSGRHSNRFVQKFRFLEDPALLAGIVAAMLERMPALDVQCVVSAPSRHRAGLRSGASTRHARDFRRERGWSGPLPARFRRRSGRAGAGGGRRDHHRLSVREVIDVVSAEGGWSRRRRSSCGACSRRRRAALCAARYAAGVVRAGSLPQCAAGAALDEPGSRFLR